MVLDTSVDLLRNEENAEQRLQKVLSCPEYSKEIYAYLREAEVMYIVEKLKLL